MGIGLSIVLWGGHHFSHIVDPVATCNIVQALQNAWYGAESCGPAFCSKRHIAIDA